MCKMSEQERQPNSPTGGRPTPRTIWWTCVPIHPYRSRLLRILWNYVPTRYLEETVLSLHLPNNHSSTHQIITVIGHRVTSSCSDNIHCKTWLPKHHQQWQRNEFSWSNQRVESIHEQVGNSRVTWLRKRSFGNSFHLELQTLIESGRD